MMRRASEGQPRAQKVEDLQARSSSAKRSVGLFATSPTTATATAVARCLIITVLSVTLFALVLSIIVILHNGAPTDTLLLGAGGGCAVAILVAAVHRMLLFKGFLAVSRLL